MPRKPNYKFERLERQRQKAAKKAARLEAKKEKSDIRKAEGEGFDLDGEEISDATEETSGEPE